MSSYSVVDIYRPRTMPSYTYINRTAGSDGVTYEAKLRRALSSPGTLVSITGASKTGKTVCTARSSRKAAPSPSAERKSSGQRISGNKLRRNWNSRTSG